MSQNKRRERTPGFGAGRVSVCGLFLVITKWLNSNLCCKLFLEFLQERGMVQWDGKRVQS